MTLIHGDCIEAMAGMEPESVDAIVTDPPYGLEFMGKQWDRLGRPDWAAHKASGRHGGGTDPFTTHMTTYKGGTPAQEFHARWAEAAYRVAKPSAYLLAFGGTRTVHRMTVALEDAGWIIRDMLVWGYASGFPKSKASLKPAWEPIVMARKPGPLRMLAIDECRIPTDDNMDRPPVPSSTEPGWDRPWKHEPEALARLADRKADAVATSQALGRWPANIVLSDPIFDGGIEGVVGGGETGRTPGSYDYSTGDTGNPRIYGAGEGIPKLERREGFGDTGTYSRFFLVPKSSRSDREPVLGGLPERESASYQPTEKRCGVCQRRLSGQEWKGGELRCGHAVTDVVWTQAANRTRSNQHPTVKPVDLMRHLVRLVTPTGGTVLDPFLGSGTTALAAEMEGFSWIGIEREAEYCAIAEARLNGTQRGLGLESA